MKWGLLISISLVSSIAFGGGPRECQVLGVNKCLCPASVLVKCEGLGETGYLDNDQKVISVTLALSGRTENTTLTISNPTSGVRELYLPGFDPVVVGELGKLGIELTDREPVKVISVQIGADAKIYKDVHEKDELKAVCGHHHRSQHGDSVSENGAAKPRH